MQFHDVITEKLKDAYESIEESIAKVLCLSSGFGKILCTDSIIIPFTIYRGTKATKLIFIRSKIGIQNNS